MIGIVSMHDSKYEDLAKLTWDGNKLLYCQKHGYQAFIKTDNWSDIIYFDKISHLLEVLENNPSLNWVWWLDCDTLITNFNKKIEDYVDDQYHIIIGTDIAGLNCGSFFLKNSPESKEWLKMVLDHKDQFRVRPWQFPEQQSMQLTYIKYRDWIKLVPQKDINSYCYELYPYHKTNLDWLKTSGQWSPGDWVLHFPGLTWKQRIDIAHHMQQYIVF
jgi:hypothetical protein